MTTRAATPATKTPADRSAPAPSDWYTPLMDIFANVQDIIGSDSAYSLFHYAAQESGRKIARTEGPDGLRIVLELMERWYPVKGTVLEEHGPTVDVRFQYDEWDHDERRIMRATVMGLLEGAIGFIRGAPYEGKVLNGVPPGTPAVRIQFNIRRNEGGASQ